MKYIAPLHPFFIHKMNTNMKIKNLVSMSLMLILATSPLLSWAQALAPQRDLPANRTKRKVQVALLLDTSNSMDGLIEQAKSRLWDIVNTLSTLYYDNSPANIEIALYQYGNDNLSTESRYIQKIRGFGNDLDALSEVLFGLRTLGGSEYCGAVIKAASDELKWSDNKDDIKIIYIAGNESFAQGPINFKNTLPSIRDAKDIQINTIFCGAKSYGIDLNWERGAKLGGGKYFAIESNNKISHIPTPYDDSILYCNTLLNKTYIAYGKNQEAVKNFMIEQDNKAQSISKENMAKRAISKSKKSAYQNDHWDIVDAYEKDEQIIEKLSEQELPDEMKELSKEEKKDYVLEKASERQELQKKISKLNVKRNKYVADHRDTDMKDDDFGLAIIKSVEEVARAKGYEMRP